MKWLKLWKFCCVNKPFIAVEQRSIRNYNILFMLFVMGFFLIFFFASKVPKSVFAGNMHTEHISRAISKEFTVTIETSVFTHIAADLFVLEFLQAYRSIVRIAIHGFLSMLREILFIRLLAFHRLIVAMYGTKFIRKLYSAKSVCFFAHVIVKTFCSCSLHSYCGNDQHK